MFKEFSEPTSIIVKHANACGAASSKNIETAFHKSYNSDPKEINRGIIF